MESAINEIEIYETYPTVWDYEHIYMYRPMSLELLGQVLSEFFKIPVKTYGRTNEWGYDDMVEFEVEGKTHTLATNLSGEWPIGELTVEEYFDTEANLTLPKEHYQICPITDDSMDELPDSRLFEVMGILLGVLVAKPYGNGGFEW